MPYMEPWKRIEKYINSLTDSLVQDVGKFFREVDAHIAYLKEHYRMPGTWSLNANTTSIPEVVELTVINVDRFRRSFERRYKVRLHIYTKRVGDIYIDKSTDTYYKCLEYNPQLRQYKWRQVTKVLWWYFETWGKKAFWASGEAMQELGD